MIQHFSFTFFPFLILQRNFFPLRLRHQTSATKLRLLQATLEKRFSPHIALVNAMTTRAYSVGGHQKSILACLWCEQL